VGSIEGRVVAVTGASRGLGRRMALDLAAAGARVALIARPSDELAEAAASLGDMGCAIPGDVGDAASMARAFEAAVARFGRLDALVNNAALYQPIDLETSPPEVIQQHVAVNLLGAMWCVRAALPHLKAAGGGDIVNVSSAAVRVTPPMLGVYAATKAGLEALSAALRTELKPEGIRVTVLRIGAVAGGTGARDLDPRIRERFLEALSKAPRVGGTPVSQETLAGILIHILGLPREVTLDMVDASPSR
jgi:NAD(P)-dependent dehydrogenase (short-subunit alcohol dehydrogenase family)